MRFTLLMGRVRPLLAIAAILTLLGSLSYSLSAFSSGAVSIASAAGSAYEIAVSTSPDRTNPVPLAGLTVQGNIYVFSRPDTGVDRVRFYLDDPNLSRSARQVENNAPYDFAGGNASTAQPFATTRVADGSHTITAALDLTGGGTQIVHATFTVANTGPALVFNPRDLTFSLGEAGTASKSTNLGTTDQSTTNYSVSDNADWLSVSPANGTTPATLAVLVDANGLSAGTHTATVTATASGYATATLAVSLTISQAFDQVHLAWTDDPSTTLTVVWRTWDTATPSMVEYRPLGSSTWLTQNGALRPSGTSGTLHEVTISALNPSTSYEYRVRGDGSAWSDVFVARTAPPLGPADFDAVYLADTGLVGRTDGLATGTQQVVDEIAALNPLLVLPGGDYAYYDTDKRYGSLDNTIDAWFNQMQPIAATSALMPTYGNHEALLGENVTSWVDRFPTPDGLDNRQNYSFDVGDVHFVSIFAVYNSSGLTNSQLAWIENDIQAAKAAGRRWIIPYFHVSPFSDGSNHPSNLALRQQLGPLFERLGVKIVIASHDQSYERTYPLTDVPATNRPTSTARTCYTMADGVTWVKVSPGGKLSNISRGFSPFTTNPAPSWTAFRDNTMHHFLRIVASASGSIRLDAYGVRGDGTPPVIQDSFQYTTGGCPNQLAWGSQDLTFSLQQGTASKTVTLATADGTAANFAVSDNAAWLTVSPVSGTTPATITATANADNLSPGTYSGTITATAPGYASASRQVSLTVTSTSGSSYQMLVSTSPDRSNPVALQGQAVSGNIYAFTSPGTGVAKVRFYLDNTSMTGTPRQVERNAPHDFASGTTSTANPFNTATIANGSHTITAALDLTNGQTAVVHATFTVNN